MELLEILDLGDVGEISVVSLIIESVAYDEVVGDFETYVVDVAFHFQSIGLF